MLKFLIMFSFYVSSEKDSPFDMRNVGGNHDKFMLEVVSLGK